MQVCKTPQSLRSISNILYYIPSYIEWKSVFLHFLFFLAYSACFSRTDVNVHESRSQFPGVSSCWEFIPKNISLTITRLCLGLKFHFIECLNLPHSFLSYQVFAIFHIAWQHAPDFHSWYIIFNPTSWNVSNSAVQHKTWDFNFSNSNVLKFWGNSLIPMIQSSAGASQSRFFVRDYTGLGNRIPRSQLFLATLLYAFSYRLTSCIV